jgi:hypothetical protein
VNLVATAPLPPEAQRAACAADDALRSALASNLNVSLAPDVWRDLLTANLPAADAEALVARELPGDLLSWVLANERRVRVVVCALTHNNPSRSELLGLLGTKFGAKVAAKLPHRLLADIDVHRAVALAAGGAARLDFCYRDDVSDAEARSLLADFAVWRPHPSAVLNATLRRLLADRPALVDVFAQPDADEALQLVAAGSLALVDDTLQRNLAAVNPATHFMWSALVSNPVVSLDVVAEVAARAEASPHLADAAKIAGYRLHPRTGRRPQVTNLRTVADVEVLEWLCNRAYPRADSSSRCRYDELVELAHNPHLSATQAERVANGLCDYWVAYEVPPGALRRAFAALSANFPAAVAHRQQPVRGDEYASRCYWLGPTDGSVAPPTPPLRPTFAMLEMGQNGTPTSAEELTVNMVGFAGRWLCSPGVVRDAEAWALLFTLVDDAEGDDGDDLLVDLVAAANTLSVR